MIFILISELIQCQRTAKKYSAGLEWRSSFHLPMWPEARPQTKQWSSTMQSWTEPLWTGSTNCMKWTSFCLTSPLTVSTIMFNPITAGTQNYSRNIKFGNKFLSTFLMWLHFHQCLFLCLEQFTWLSMNTLCICMYLLNLKYPIVDLCLVYWEIENNSDYIC